MKHLHTFTRSAGCIALFALLASCAKKEAAPAPAPVMAEMSVAPSAAPAAPPPPPMGGIVSARERADVAGKLAAEPSKDVASATSATPVQQMASSAATYNDGQRKFIRTANARFQVKDVYLAALGVEDTVASHGGFVVKNDIGATTATTESHPVGDGKLLELSEYNVQGQLTVRVPSAKTQEFLRAIAGHIVFLDQRSFSAHDAQFDMLREQLEMIRNQETQADLGDAVREGGRLVHRTDAIAARNETKAARDAALVARKEFEDQVAFSTIELTLYQPARVLRTEKVDVAGIYRQYRQSFFSRLGEKLQSGWFGLQDVALGLVGIWPLLLIGAMLLPLLSRARRALRRKPAAD